MTPHLAMRIYDVIPCGDCMIDLCTRDECFEYNLMHLGFNSADPRITMRIHAFTPWNRPLYRPLIWHTQQDSLGNHPATRRRR